MMVFVVKWISDDDPFAMIDLDAVFSTIEKADGYVKSEAERCNLTLGEVEDFFEDTLTYPFTAEWGAGEVTIEGFEIDEGPHEIIERDFEDGCGEMAE